MKAILLSVFTTFCLLVGIGMSAQQATSANLEVDLGLKAQAGLDPSTRDFLDHYPTEIREQVILLLQQAIPLLNAEMKQFFDRYDQSVATSFSQLHCSIDRAQAAPAGAWERLVSKVFHPSRPSFPKTAQDFENWTQEQRSQISSKDTAEHIAFIYADILNASWSTQCALGDAAAPAIQSVQSTTEKLIVAASTWVFVDGFECNSMHDCYIQLYNYVKQEGDRADKRDLSQIDFTGVFEKIPKPSPDNVNGFGSGRFDLKVDEEWLTQLVNLEAGLAAASLDRRNKAMKMIATAAELLGNAQHERDDIMRGPWSSSDPAAVDRSYNRDLPRVRGDILAIDLTPALQESYTVRPLADELIVKRDALVVAINSTIAGGCDHLHYTRVQHGDKPGRECGT